MAGLMFGVLAACGGGGGSSPVVVATARADSAAVSWNTASTLDVGTNDSVANGSAVLSITSAPTHGSAEVVGQSIRYIPSNGYFGPDSLRYSLTVGNAKSDADVQIAVSASIPLSGSVGDTALAGASVVATVGETAFPAVTAGADGRYSMTVSTSDPGAYIRLEARGAGALASLALSALVGEARSAAAFASVSSASSGASAMNLNSASTAMAVLSRQSLGRWPSSEGDIATLQDRLSATQILEMTTVLRLIADGEFTLPAGTPDTLALVSSPVAYKEFLLAPGAADSDIVFYGKQDALRADTRFDGPPPATSSSAMLLLPGAGIGLDAAIRLVLRKDGTASFVGDAAHEATWQSDGQRIVVVYTVPAISTVDSDDADPVFGVTNLVRRRETGLVLRQWAGVPGLAPVFVAKTGDAIYLDGSRRGQAAPFPAAWTALGVRSNVGAITAADLAVGTRWAGPLVAQAPRAGSFATDQDILRIIDAGTLVFERSQQSASYRLVNGTLEVTSGDTVMTYTRLFTGESGEEHWLAELRAASGMTNLFELPVFRVQDGASFSPAGLARRWAKTFDGEALSYGEIAVDLNADGTGAVLVTAIGTGESIVTRDPWRLDSSGQMILGRSDFDCASAAPDCVMSRQRTWQLLGVDGNRMHVMEHFQFPAAGLDRYWIATYTPSP